MRKLIGKVGIDTGTLLLVDPCNLESVNFESVANAMGKVHRMSAGIPYPLGHEGMAVAVVTGLGDGLYPVYATITNVPGWGERVTKIEVEFWPHPILGTRGPEALSREPE